MAVENSQEAAGLIASGAFAAGAYHYATPVKGWAKTIGGTGLMIAGSWLFGEGVSDATGLVLNVAGAVAGLSCLGLSQGVIAASKKADFGSWIHKRKDVA